MLEYSMNQLPSCSSTIMNGDNHIYSPYNELMKSRRFSPPSHAIYDARISWQHANNNFKDTQIPQNHGIIYAKIIEKLLLLPLEL